MVAQINGSVLKAFQILSLFEDGRREVNASVLADRLDMNAITAHRFLRTLEATGALVAVAKGSYRLGFALADLGALAADPAGLSGLAQAVLDELVATVGEGALASTFDGERAVCIARSVPDRPLFVDIRRGTRLEAYCTAHGKLWLAQLPDAELDRYLDTVERRSMTAGTLVQRDALVRDLERVRFENTAYNRGEREGDINAVAVPVFSRGGRMVFGLSIFGSASRFGEAEFEKAAGPLRAAAAELSRRLYGDAAS